MGDPKKKIGLLCLLLLVSSGWIALTSRRSGITAGQKTQDNAVLRLGVLHAEDRMEETRPPATRQDSSSFLNDPNLSSTPSVSLGNGELFLRMMLSVGVVIGLGAVALYLSKRALPRVVKVGGKEIRIRETAYLGPRKALHLVEVGSQRLLIASTSDSITMLTPLHEAWLDLPKAERGSQTPQVAAGSPSGEAVPA